jgi:integrase
MVEVQHLCGCRPQDVVLMRRIDFDTHGPVWGYRPSRHKTEHLNEDDDPDLERVIFLGPRAQEVLRPFLDRAPDAYLFSPHEAEAARNEAKRAGRKTPRWPSHARRQQKLGSGRPRAALQDHYDVAAYRRTIRRACAKAGVAA